jgi:hypothetical protein
MFGAPKGDIGFDLESFPNIFTGVFTHVKTLQTWKFEISTRRNDIHQFRSFVLKCVSNGVRWAGFNNLFYDYPLIHYICSVESPTAASIYRKSKELLSGGSFDNQIWDKDMLVPQIDLFKIWHFDNKARSTSLKMIENNIRMDRIQESTLEFDVDVPIERMDEVVDYNIHDVVATVLLYNITRGEKDGVYITKNDKIAFREELSLKYKKNFINFNDTKIGKEFFIMKLMEADPDSCYYYENRKRKPRQTPRATIPFKEMLLDYITFEDDEFQAFYDNFKTIVVTQTKDSLKGVHHIHKGFQFDFGTGGIHGSVKEMLVEAAEDEVLLDIDVTSYYPSLSIVNNFCPEHLGKLFCEIYKELFDDRNGKYTKKDYPTINLMLKLALNGVYGDSNSKFSPFYDPHMTMKITLNGQLLLCMLAESLMKRVTLYQINTDGMTFRVKRSDLDWVKSITSDWEKLTGLQLEEARYKKMLIRDVNNYMAVYENGDVKQKGAYETKRDLHKNHSMMVVPKAAYANFIHGDDIAEFIYNHDNPLDFCLRTKIARSDRLLLGDKPQQRVTRYYVATEGERLMKVMPPAGPEHSYKRKQKLTDSFYEKVIAELDRHEVIRKEDGWVKTSRYGNESWVQPKYFAMIDGVEVEVDITGLPYDARIHNKKGSKHDPQRETILHQGASVHVCNNITGEKFDKICYDWYIEQAEKLVKGMTADMEYDDVEE